jgi:predicted membrane protein
MAEKRHSYFNMRLIIGLAIIIVGAIALLVNLGYDVDIDLWDYWPLILVLIGLSRIFQPPEYRNLWFGLIFTAIGILFLLDNFYLIRFGFRELWPLVIILIGVAILKHGYGLPKGRSTDVDYIDHSAILGGGEYNYTSKSLKGGKLFAFMGGCEVDLREADMEGDEIVIDVFTMMGGVEIKVPDSWQVTARALPILGGFSNKTSRRQSLTGSSATVKTLLVKGTAIMGGVEVKN